MTGLFTMRKHDEGAGVVRILVGGEVDSDASAALGLFIANATEQHGVRALIVDLERVPLLTAAGIRSLLTGHEAAARVGCSYQLVNIREGVMDVLQAAGVEGLLLAGRDASVPR